MALTLPGAPWPGHDTRFYRPGDVIIAADAGQPTAHWQALVADYNLALGTLHAGAIASDSWADDQGVGIDSGGSYVEQLRYPIPPQPSSRHSQIRVVVRVANADGGIRASTVAGGDVLASVVAGTDVFDELLDVDTSAGYDELVIDSIGEVDIISAEVSWADLSVAGWPAAAGVLPDVAFDDIDPFDTSDYAAGECLSSGRMLAIHAASAHLVGRRRGLLSTSALANAGSGPKRFVARPIRRVVPVPYRGVDVVGRARIANPDDRPLNLWVRLGRARPRDVVDREPDLREIRVEIPATTAMGWVDFEGRLRDDREFSAPRDLPGWTQIGVYAEDKLELHAIGIWEAP